jgi:hypothetical protein
MKAKFNLDIGNIDMSAHYLNSAIKLDPKNLNYKAYLLKVYNESRIFVYRISRRIE